MLTLNNLSIYGPPAFDGASFAEICRPACAIRRYERTNTSASRTSDLIRSNDRDSGTISNSTFQGGSIEVFGGPWNITDNTVLGSTADTYSPGAFGLALAARRRGRGQPGHHSPIPPAASSGLWISPVSGFDNTIEDNSFGGGAGQIGNEMTYVANAGQFGGINDPEVILAES